MRTMMFVAMVLLTISGSGCNDEASQSVKKGGVTTDRESISLGVHHGTKNGADELKEISPVVLSTDFGVCINPNLPVNVNFDSIGDFTPGNIRVGIDSSFRRIDYGIGTRFDNELPFVLQSKTSSDAHHVFSADDKKLGVTFVKVIGVSVIPNSEIRFSYPIGDTISARYVDQIVANLLKCQVVSLQ